MPVFGFLNLSEPENPFKVASKDVTSLGCILVELEYITLKDLEKAINIQKTRSPLGRILVDDMEVITEEQLEEALLEQKIRRKKISMKEMSEFYSKRNGRLVTEISDLIQCAVEKAEEK